MSSLFLSRSFDSIFFLALPFILSYFFEHVPHSIEQGPSLRRSALQLKIVALVSEIIEARSDKVRFGAICPSRETQLISLDLRHR